MRARISGVGRRGAVMIIAMFVLVTLFVLGLLFLVLTSGALTVAKRDILLVRWNYTGTAANCNICGPTIRYSLPDLPAGRFDLILRVKDHPEWNSEYMLKMCD